MLLLRLHIDGLSEICPATGCLGTSLQTKLKLGQGTEYTRTLYALERGQPVQWWWLLILTEWQRKIQAGEVAADSHPYTIPDREPEVQLSNRLGACLRPSGPQTGRSRDGELWQKVRKMYNQLDGANLLQQTNGKSKNWTTLAQRFKEDDGKWNESVNSWAKSQLNGGRNLEWMIMADKMHAEERQPSCKRSSPIIEARSRHASSAHVGHCS